MQSLFGIFRKILPILLLFVLVNMAGQEQKEQKHLLGAGFGFTFVPLGDALGDTDERGVFTKTVGLDYFYNFNPRWGAGFLSALELDHYVVTDEQVERENAIILTLVGMYSATKYLDLFLGGGGFERVDKNIEHRTMIERSFGLKQRLNLYLPSRTGMVLKKMKIPGVR